MFILTMHVYYEFHEILLYFPYGRGIYVAQSNVWGGDFQRNITVRVAKQWFNDAFQNQSKWNAKNVHSYAWITWCVDHFILSQNKHNSWTKVFPCKIIPCDQMSHSIADRKQCRRTSVAYVVQYVAHTCSINKRSWGNWVVRDCSHFWLISCAYAPFLWNSFDWRGWFFRSFTHSYWSKLKHSSWPTTKLCNNLKNTHAWVTTHGRIQSEVISLSLNLFSTHRPSLSRSLSHFPFTTTTWFTK